MHHSIKYKIMCDLPREKSKNIQCGSIIGSTVIRIHFLANCPSFLTAVLIQSPSVLIVNFSETIMMDSSCWHDFVIIWQQDPVETDSVWCTLLLERR